MRFFWIDLFLLIFCAAQRIECHFKHYLDSNLRFIREYGHILKHGFHDLFCCSSVVHTNWLNFNFKDFRDLSFSFSLKRTFQHHWRKNNYKRHCCRFSVINKLEKFWLRYASLFYLNHLLEKYEIQFKEKNSIHFNMPSSKGHSKIPFVFFFFCNKIPPIKIYSSFFDL